MKRLLLAVSFFGILSTVPALAAETVNFAMKANQQSLRDVKAKDTFTVDLSDRQVETSFKITCQAGKTGLIKRTDESCAVTGNGVVVNNGKKFQRAQYAGGWVVKADGFTDGGTLAVNYLAVGKVPASSASFGGNMMLKPENPSNQANAWKEAILKKIGSAKGSTGLIDTRVDTIELSNFTIPSAGMPSDKGCSWSGNMGFSYQTESWIIDVQANCAGKVIPLKGNMPWTDSKDVPNQTEYNLTLTLPTAGAASDDALFAAPAEGDTDLFAAADGITGQIIMKESGIVTVKVDGEDTEVPSQIEATGSFAGQNVPIETVRSLAQLISIMARTFFGA